MLFAISLAEKLGSHGLQAYSLHPGAILETSLGSHLDGLENLGMLPLAMKCICC